MASKNNGKQSEKAIHAVLEKMAQLPQFDYQRVYDAGSARNAFQAQVGDFLFFLPNAHGVIEVKSTQHNYRLSRRAFGDTQYHKLRKRSKVTPHVYVLVHHYLINKWRVVSFREFDETLESGTAASVDFRDKFNKDLFDSPTEAMQAILVKVLN